MVIHVESPVHERVKSHFDRAGLSHADIATEAARRSRSEWSERKVTRILTGVTDLKVEHLEVFAAILGKPVTALYRAAARRAS